MGTVLFFGDSPDPVTKKRKKWGRFPFSSKHVELIEMGAVLAFRGDLHPVAENPSAIRDIPEGR
jgi:hypothetical protein